jgi:hypothetical protein
MAKAVFHRHQRVYVDPVGTWAVIDRINPVWVKGFDEPVKVTYDCGLGRDFTAEELSPEPDRPAGTEPLGDGKWRLMRARNKWQNQAETGNHPFPGTYPVVVTDVNDWGGWRVPGAEYDRDPSLIEMQARLIAAAPNLLRLAKDLRDYVRDNSEDLDSDMIDLAKRAEVMRKQIEATPADMLTPTA